MPTKILNLADCTEKKIDWKFLKWNVVTFLPAIAFVATAQILTF